MYNENNNNPGGLKRISRDERKIEVDPETHPKVVIIMEKIVKEFKGVHINKFLKPELQ